MNKPLIQNGMVTLGNYTIYGNKREFGRKLRLIMKNLKNSIPIEYRDNAVWRNTKPIARAHNLDARIGFISVMVCIPKELYETV